MFISDRKQRSMNVTVNLWVVNERWLFSLLWCAGASSVTTNSCHLLKDMDRPDLAMVSNSCKYSSVCCTALAFLSISLSSLKNHRLKHLFFRADEICAGVLKKKTSLEPMGMFVCFRHVRHTE